MEAVAVLGRRAHRERHASRAVVTRAVTVRCRTPGEHGSLERLARLDSASMPTGPILVAEFAGELVAVLALDSGRAIANPFRHTAEVVHELRCQAAELRPSPSPSRRRFRPAYLARTSPVGAG